MEKEPENKGEKEKVIKKEEEEESTQKENSETKNAVIDEFIKEAPLKLDDL
ncbi:MAG: hypothetical protein ABI550_00535 [Ignavibacteriaceae bacterium]